MEQHPAGAGFSYSFCGSPTRSKSEIRNPKSEGRNPAGGTKLEPDRKKWNFSDFDLRNSFGLRVSDFGLCNFHTMLQLRRARLLANPASMSGWGRGTSAGALDYASFVVSASA